MVIQTTRRLMVFLSMLFAAGADVLGADSIPASAGSPASVTASPGQILYALIIAAIAVLFWWVREQRLAAQRNSVRALHSLSEGIIAAGSPEDIAEKLADMLPGITRATHVRLYLYNRRAKSLEAVPTADDPEPRAIPLETALEGMAAAAERCFRTRETLHIADARRNPLVSAAWTPEQLRAALFVPLVAQKDIVGVLEAGRMNRAGYFSPDEQAAIQHVANQVTASLKLQDQQKVREQLLRGEKLAATGQLISGIASQLRAPLESIVELSSARADRPSPAPDVDLRQIEIEARRASEIVARLVSFARPQDSAARPVDVHSLTAGLIQFREAERKTAHLRVQNRLAPDPAMVVGVQGHLEQVILDLLVYAEQSAARSSAKNLMIASSRLGGRIVIEIAYSTDQPDNAAFNGSGMDIRRGLIQGHGGEIRFRTQSGSAAYEVDLPLAPGSERGNGVATTPREASRPLTVMLVDSDATDQRQLMGLLAARGHRVIPVTAEQSAETAHRLRFDVVIWAVRPGGWKWSEFHERLRLVVPAFVLVSDGYDAEFAQSLEESGGFLLARPIQTTELDRMLEELDQWSRHHQPV